MYRAFTASPMHSPLLDGLGSLSLPLLFILSGALGCGQEPQPVEPHGAQAQEAGAHLEDPQPPRSSDRMAAPTAEDEAYRRPEFVRPDLEFRQDLLFGPGDPDPSKQRLEPLTSYGGEQVEFYEQFFPDTGGLRLQGHRLLLEPDQQDADEPVRVAHGPEWRWFESGQIQVRRVYDHGKMSGDSIEWFSNGYKKSKGTFLNDRAEGEWVRWAWRSGRLKEVATWRKGLNDGPQYTLWPRRNLKSVVPWTMGKKHGVERSWWPKGGLNLIRTWSMGVEDGPYFEWGDEGKVLLRRGEYSAGERNNTWEEWHENGAKKLIGHFQNGERVGEWTTWLADGTQATLEHYLDGALHGAKKVWTPEGVLIFEGDFDHGKPAAEHRKYFLGGGPKEVLHYVDGLLEGPCTYWHPSGGKESEGPMKAGKRHGRWKVWNTKGEELKAYGGLYENGTRVSD